jgi:hypothetical protein
MTPRLLYLFVFLPPKPGPKVDLNGNFKTKVPQPELFHHNRRIKQMG